MGPRTFDVTAQVKIDHLAGRGRSQFRLRAPVDTDNDNQGDFVTFAGGEDPRIDDRPILKVVFETN